MSASNFDRLDALIALSVKDCIDEEVNNFLKTEVTVTPSTGFTGKIARLVRKSKTTRHPFYKPLRIVAVAILIALSIMFTACVSIPRVREAVWNAIIEWYDDYISIRFTAPESSSESTSESRSGGTSGSAQRSISESTSGSTQRSILGNSSGSSSNEIDTDKPAVSATPPKTIETVNAPTYIPYGYMVISYTSQINFYQEYYDADGNFSFYFYQNLKGTKHNIDNKDATVSSVVINNKEGLLITGEGDTMSVIWEDDFYSYMINGQFDTEEEILKIASSVKVIKN
ncbi:MAG: DUF4367 domain-containing protein [Eubacteriales bacterium]